MADNSLNYNFDTREMVACDISTLSDAELIAYIPRFDDMSDGGPARGLFRVLRQIGKPRLEAYAEALRAYTGAR